MEDGVLRRWSQRKQAARDAAPGPEPEAAPVSRDAAAGLPAIDTLTADSDVTGFLRPGVPDALRNAALRRIWTLDPAIRDFAGHARDYDYDWNRPGGVPGSGPLEPAQVAVLVRQLFGEPPPSRGDGDETDSASDVAAQDRSAIAPKA
jgi:hypothetical protein